MAGHLQREHRPAGDLERQELQDSEKVDRLGGHGREPRQRLAADLGDMAAEQGDDPGRQRRRDDAPLQLPVLAIAEEQPPSHDRPQDADRGRRAAVVGGVVHQHLLDAVGRVQQQALPAEEPLDQ